MVTDKLRERAVELGFNNCIFYLALMDTNNRFLEDHHRFFSSIIEEDFSGTCFYLNINEYQSVVIIKSDKILSKKTLINTGEKLIEKTKKVYHKDLFLIFSNPIVKINDLYEEYISLEELLDYKFFTDKGSVLINQEEYITGNNIPVIIDAMLKRIYEYIEYGEFESVLKSVNLLMNTIENTSGLSSIYVKHIFLDIMDRIYKKTITYDCVDINENMKKIMQFNNMKQLNAYVLKTIDNVVLSYRRSHQEKASGKKVIDDVLSIIRREYSEDIGLEYIANQVCLSPNYLSYIFKKTMGESIIKYISKFRLEKSEELLKDTNMKINDISKAVGFSNCTYFVTVFKNQYGLTPAKYRKQLTNAHSKLV